MVAAALAAGGEEGLLGKDVLLRIEALREEYQPRLKTEKGRAAFERQLGSLARKLRRSLEKPTGVTDEHLGSLRGLWDATVAFDSALSRATDSPSPENTAALDRAREGLRASTKLLASLPEALRPEWVRPESADGGGEGQPGRRRPPGLGAFLMELGDALGARRTFDAAAAANPKDSSALAGRASAAFGMGDFASAYGDARRALELDPDDRVALAVLKLAEGRGGAAGVAGAPASGAARASASASAAAAPVRAAASAVPVSSPGALEAARWNREALAAMKLGDRAAALLAAERALAAYPENPVAHSVRARLLLQARDYRAAFDAASAGLRLAPGDRTLLGLKARAANRLRQAPAAGEAAAELLAMDPADPEGLANLAYARGLSGDRTGMLSLLRKAAEADPQYQASLQSALSMPADAAELFLFPGEASPGEVLAALRAAKEPQPKGFSLPWVGLSGLGGGLLLAAAVLTLKRRL